MPRELPVISAYFPLGDIRTSSGRAGERFTAAKGAPSLAAGSWLVKDQRDPPNDTRDAVDGDRGSLGDPPRRAPCAEHRWNAALPRQRGKVRGAAAELGHDSRRAPQTDGEPRAPHLRDDDAAGRDAVEVPFVQDQARRTGPPPAPRRLTGQRRVATPDLVRRAARLDAQRSGLEDPEPLPVLRPLELDGRTELGLRLEHEARERGGLSVGQTRHRDPLGFHAVPRSARSAMPRNVSN